MAQHSEIDRRAKRYAPRQCLSDYGMHKDAGSKQESFAGKIIYRARPGKRTYRARTLKDDLIALRGGER